MDAGQREFLEKVGRDFKSGGEIPPYSAELQEKVRGRLSQCGSRLNQLFGNDMHPDRKNIAPQTRFMATPEFFEKAIVGDNELPT